MCNDQLLPFPLLFLPLYMSKFIIPVLASSVFFSFSISYWQGLTRETRLIYLIVHLSIEYLYHKEHNWRKYSRRSVRTVYVQVIKIVNDIWNKSYMNCGNEMKMKKWSSQSTQFMQLRKEAWKKIGLIWLLLTLLISCFFFWQILSLSWSGITMKLKTTALV